MYATDGQKQHLLPFPTGGAIIIGVVYLQSSVCPYVPLAVGKAILYIAMLSSALQEEYQNEMRIK